MGVVRREGEWRLEKVDDGVYEVTHREGLEAKIITSDYNPDMFDERFDTIPVHEVKDFPEVTDLFEEFAAGSNPSAIGGFGPAETGGEVLEFDSGVADGSGLEDIENLPPGGIALVFLIAGGIFVYSFDFAIDSLPTLIGAIMVLIGLGVFAWAAVIAWTEGARAAVSFLVTTNSVESEQEGSDSDTDESPAKTPPAPQSLKDELYFERASQHCEWCDDRTDQPEVHHITPRSDGGPNEPSNLIVLCPDCHAKADRGAISKTKLRSKLRRVTQ